MLAAQAVWVYERSILTWPEDELQQPILKLDRLAPANGFGDHDAHDALGDVEATIHIARLIRDRAPRLWADILANRNKHDVSARLQRFEPMDLVLRYKGPPRICTGCLCGFSEANPNSAGFFDLHLGDPADFVDADDDVIAQAISGSRKIIRSVSINNVPNLFQTYSHNPELFEKASLIGSRPDFRKRVARALAARFEDRELDAKRPVETRIYEGFYSGADKALLREFQSCNWPQRWDIVLQLQDPRLQQLGRRLVAFNKPGALDGPTRDAALAYLNEKWLALAEEKAKWTSFATADKDLADIEAEGLASGEMIARWKAFYSERKAWLEMGRLINH